jgi:hypothetical protein
MQFRLDTSARALLAALAPDRLVDLLLDHVEVERAGSCTGA